MAYPTVSGVYGLLPINLIGGQVFAGATRSIPITSASATAIFYGDVVKLASGVLEKDAGTSAATPVGVFLGCRYTDPVYGLTFRQFYPGAVTASDIMAFVADDPDQLFKAVIVTSGTTVGQVARSVVGKNLVLVQNSGNTITGDSAVALSNTAATTSTWPVRVIDVIAESSPAANSFSEVIVKWNQGMHQYLNPTGV
jgi:hypothetical protein